jgi:hypothetical protein
MARKPPDRPKRKRRAPFTEAEREDRRQRAIRQLNDPKSRFGKPLSRLTKAELLSFVSDHPRLDELMADPSDDHLLQPAKPSRSAPKPAVAAGADAGGLREGCGIPADGSTEPSTGPPAVQEAAHDGDVDPVPDAEYDCDGAECGACPVCLELQHVRAALGQDRPAAIAGSHPTYSNLVQLRRQLL